MLIGCLISPSDDLGGSLHLRRVTKNEAVITVADKGPGLPPEFEKSAFRQFVRGTGNPGGSGLGLSVVQAIARAHGGDAIYQRVAKQSLFRILLPVKSD